MENRTNLNTDPFLKHYKTSKRLFWGIGIIIIGVIIAGFWNFHLVDGFGRDIIAGKTIGDTTAIAGSYGERGGGFGFVFAAIAGLAATFTACNCVAFAMIPGLACSTDKNATRNTAMRAIVAFITPVVLVGAVYGIFIGFLGPQGIEFFNEPAVRGARARATFSLIGVVMLIWGLIELGFFKRIISRLSPLTQEFFSAPVTKATLLGILVGFFAIGRPFPVFREFLTYAAAAESPTYGALVMMIHGLGQIAILLGLFFILVWFAGNRMLKWAAEKPFQPRMVTALALLGGGSYFLFYWGVSRLYDIGRWGYKLGWYG